MLLKNLHCLNKVPKSSHLHSLNLALNVVINLVAKLFFFCRKHFFLSKLKMSNKTKKAPVQEFSKQRRLLSFSWHGQRFLQYSMIFCDSMFSSLITSMLQKNIAQDITLQDCYFPSFAMPYLTYWHQPKGNWITHWLEVGSFKLRADEDYMSFTWWCKKLVRRLSFLKWHFYSKFSKSKKEILQFDCIPMKLVKSVKSKFR